MSVIMKMLKIVEIYSPVKRHESFYHPHKFEHQYSSCKNKNCTEELS